MLNTRNVLAAVLIVMFLSLVGACVSLLRSPTGGGLGVDTYGTRGHGFRGLFEILEQLEIPVERTTVPPDRMLDRNMTLALIQPRPEIVSTEPAYLNAVGTLHPAIEIPDSRFTSFVRAGEAQLIADNACAHLFVLGEPTDADWRARDLIEERPVITLRGERYIGHGKNVLGDPRVALAWCVNELRTLGITLRAGEVVTTGTCCTPLPIQAGDFFAADFGALGKVSVGFS